MTESGKLMQWSGLKADVRVIMKEHAPKLFFISIITIVILTIMSEFQYRLPGTIISYDELTTRLGLGEIPNYDMIFTKFRPVGAVLALIIFLIRPVIEVGFMSYCILTTRGSKGDYSNILDGFQIFGKIVLISVITTILITLWSILLLFPGLIAYYRYRQAYYILLDAPEKSALECIRESKQLMAGNKLDLFLLDLSFIGWFICDIIVTQLLPTPFAIPIISIWLTPYMGLTLAAYYNLLIRRIVV